MTEKIQAIVIKSSDKKEKDKNILLFSHEKGKFWATLKGVKGANAKMKMAQNPFCFGEFILEDGKFGKIVTGFESIETFYELSEDVEKYFEGTAMLEIVNSLNFSNETEQTGVFLTLLKSLKTLCFEKVENLYVLDKFLLDVFALSGFPLYTEKCTGCGTSAFEHIYIDYNTGELVCTACKNYSCEETSKNSYLAMKILNNTSLDKLKTVKLAQGSEEALLRVLVKNFEARFERRLKLIGILS